MSEKTLEQKIAEKEAQIARLKKQAEKNLNGQKIVIGGMIMSLAKKDPVRAKRLLSDIKNNVTRKTDLNRLDDLMTELEKKANEINHQPNHFNQ